MEINKTDRISNDGAVEPLQPLAAREIQKVVQSGDFAAHLERLGGADSAVAESQTIANLRQIAAAADLSADDGTDAAVRQTAQMLVASRLNPKTNSAIIEEITDFIAADPFLSEKIKSLLLRLR
jgi:hypothetical protein